MSEINPINSGTENSGPVTLEDQPKNNEKKSKHPRNWMDILLKIGLGICIFALLVMILKLMGGSETSLFDEIREGRDGKKKEDSDDFTIFPGLFDEPITIFERGDNFQINNLNKEITILQNIIKNYSNLKGKMESTCQDFNKKIDGLKNISDNSLYMDKYNKIIDNCKKNGCSINSKQHIGHCKGRSLKFDDKECNASYIDAYKISNSRDILNKNICDPKKCILDISNKSSGYVDSASNFVDKMSDSVNNLYSGSNKSSGYVDSASNFANKMSDSVNNLYSGSNKSSGYVDSASNFANKISDSVNNLYSGSNKNNIEGMTNDGIKDICIVENIQDIQKKLDEKINERNKLISYKIQFG